MHYDTPFIHNGIISYKRTINLDLNYNKKFSCTGNYFSNQSNVLLLEANNIPVCKGKLKLKVKNK